MSEESPHLSVVFQGLLGRDYETLKANAAFLRAHLKDVEIIFSGWNNDLTSEQKASLDATVLEQQDPGPTFQDPITGVPHNVARQVVSTCAGLGVAKGKYVAKIRSDIVIRSLAFFENLSETHIRVLDIGTMDPAKIPYLFHVSDMAQVGPREAMIDLWNYQGKYEDHVSVGDIMLGKLLLGQTGMRCTRNAVEQEILINCLQRNGRNVRLRWIDETTPEMAALSEKWIADHFEVMAYEKSGLRLPLRIVQGSRNWYYTNEALKKVASLTTQEQLRGRYRQIQANRVKASFTDPLYIKGVFLAAAYPLIMGIKTFFPSWLNITKQKTEMTDIQVSDLCIYMSSFDDYSDLWPPFFKAFFHFWPTCPYPVKLGACAKTYADDRVGTLHAHPHKNWSSRALEHLAQIKEPYVLITLDDFILRSPVETETIASILKQMKILDLLAVRLYAEPGPQIALNGYPMIGLMGVGQQNRTSTHATIWHRETLISVIRAGESLWEFEINAALRTLKFAHQVGGTWETVMDYHMAVAKGRWFYTPAKVLMEQGFLSNPPERPVMTREEEVRATLLLFMNKLVQRVTPLRLRQMIKRALTPGKYTFSG